MRKFYVLICIFLSLSNSAISFTEHKVRVQDDPVIVPEVRTIPDIDGINNDACWQDIPWQTIDQVWIPYGTEIPSEDFTGKFKIVWSGDTNLLYFLIEISDDEYVDGFIPGITSDIYNFDLTEIFIDEDNSGGKHVFDGTGSTGQDWGYNAENAFSYHIYADMPDEGQITSDCYVGDLAGTGWSSSISTNYASHFPGFALRRSGSSVIREFSLKVYNDTYEENNKEASRVTLTANKELGLSVAYCDNDDAAEEPKTRDHFFGSVYVPAAAYNDHWINADYFGTIKLIETAPSGVLDENNREGNSMKVFPNPAGSISNLQLENPYTGEISIKLFNLLGEEVFKTSAVKTNRFFSRSLIFNNLASGFYLMTTQIGKSVSCEKIIINSLR